MEKENEISEEKEKNVEKERNLEETEIIEVKETEDKHENEEIKKDEEQKLKQNIIKEENKDEESSKKVNKKILIIFPIIVIVLLFLSTIFAIINMNNTNIIKGIHIENIDISNLSKEEVINLTNEKISTIENIEVYYEEYSEIIKLKDLGIEINVKDTIDEAISIGKSNNILVDNFNILKALIFKTKLDINISIDEEKFNDMVKNIGAEIPDRIEEYSYEIKDEELIITNGKSGKEIVKEDFKEEIIGNIRNQFNGINETLEIPVIYDEPEKIDIEKIYNEIYKESKDAYIIDEPFEVYKEEDGIDLAISIEEAKEILAVEKQTYTIPLKITHPKIKIKDLGDKLFKQTLAKYTTIYDAGNYNRAHNVALAAKTLNGTILLPGETFSYNETLGNTNAAKGYKQATAYVAGKVVPSYGGGICQVSSTLYNTVLYSSLEIVERYNHSYAVSYVPAGRDATVAYGGKDFKFKNTRTYPIKIVASAKNGVVSISIKGIKEEIDKYEVVLTSSVLSTKPNSITYENNSELEEGKEKVIQKGYTGKTSIAYKIVKNPDGSIKSKTVLSKDVYKPMNKIIQVGTKKVTVQTQAQPIQTAPETTTNVNNTTI